METFPAAYYCNADLQIRHITNSTRSTVEIKLIWFDCPASYRLGPTGYFLIKSRLNCCIWGPSLSPKLITTGRQLNKCVAACAKLGSGAVVISDGPKTQISRLHLAVLISALADGTIPRDAASYIADAMIMSDDLAWDDEGVADALFRLSDESTPRTMIDLEWARRRVTSVLERPLSPNPASEGVGSKPTS